MECLLNSMGKCMHKLWAQQICFDLGRRLARLWARARESQRRQRLRRAIQTSLRYRQNTCPHALDTLLTTVSLPFGLQLFGGEMLTCQYVSNSFLSALTPSHGMPWLCRWQKVSLLWTLLQHPLLRNLRLPRRTAWSPAMHTCWCTGAASGAPAPAVALCSSLKGACNTSVAVL